MEKNIVESRDEARDVEIVVEVSADKLYAHVSIKGGNGKKVSAEQVLTAVKQEGVTYGINEEVIASFEGVDGNVPKVLVASGKKPVNGKDGELKILIDVNESALVRKGDMVAQQIPPGKEEDGVTVTGERLPASIGKLCSPGILEHVKPSIENDKIYCAATDGYLTAGPDTLVVTPFFDLEILEEGLQAFIKVTAPQNEGDFDAEDLRKFLEDNEITFGINEQRVERIFRKQRFGEKLLIAEGKRFEDGKDGYWMYFFDTRVGPKEDEKGNVDHKDLNIIQNVHKGDKLLQIMPPTNGKKGVSVTGTEILPAPGKEAAEPKGGDLEVDPNDSTAYLAIRDGHVVKKGDLITIEPLFHVQNDVDYSTGNIDCDGSVTVGGDVKSGFSIKADGDVEINGIVEDGIIEAGGNVLLKSGFTGHGHGKVEAKGMVIAQFCENQTIYSGQDISFCEYIMRCHVTTLGQLLVTEKKGLIIGGDVFAQKGVEANVVGGPSYISTKIIVGVNKEAEENKANKKLELEQVREKEQSLEKTVEAIIAKNRGLKELPQDKQRMLGKLEEGKKQLKQTEEELVAALEKIDAELGKFKDAVVKVNQTVYPKTNITIYDKHLEITEEANNVVFTYDEEGIKMLPG